MIEERSISDLDPGHTCVEIPKAPSSVSAGDNATLQIIYRADWDAPHNQTFYACADITFVLDADFEFNIPCFNATEPGEDNIAAGETATSSATATHKPVSTGASNDDDDDQDGNSSSGSSKKLSGGAIAGIVIGSIGGVSLLAIGAILLWRRKQQNQRDARIARMEDNARHHEIALAKVASSRTSGV